MTALSTKEPIHFSNTVEANCYDGSSTAIFAMYHNPEFTEPYVGIPDRHIPDLPVKVWPNPTDDVLYVELSGTGIKSVGLYDLQGRVVETHGRASLQGIVAINMRSVPAGVYVLRVTDENGREYHSKIVVR